VLGTKNREPWRARGRVLGGSPRGLYRMGGLGCGSHRGFKAVSRKGAQTLTMAGPLFCEGNCEQGPGGLLPSSAIFVNVLHAHINQLVRRHFRWDTNQSCFWVGYGKPIGKATCIGKTGVDSGFM
jgi:hypothetical protein